MSTIGETNAVQTGMSASAKRAELESQLSLAIRRAEKNYLQVQEKPLDKPSVNPSHLGVRVDIRV